MKSRSKLIAWISVCPALLLVASGSRLQAQSQRPAHHPSEMNKKFAAPELDIQEFVKRFETDSREIFAQRQAIVQAVDLRPGLAVADIGAGTGLFTWMFAEEVGPKGTVYAVEIAPAFLKSIGEHARQCGLEKVVKTVRSTQEATNLAPGSIDVAFVCATYHHFEHPEKVLASIHQALRPGGRLVVIDFDLRKDSSAFVRERACARKRCTSGRSRRRASRRSKRSHH